jgi:hypothetical protein
VETRVGTLAPPQPSEEANVKVVLKLLGHKSAVLTLDKHGHLFPGTRNLVATAHRAFDYAIGDRIALFRV